MKKNFNKFFVGLGLAGALMGNTPSESVENKESIFNGISLEYFVDENNSIYSITARGKNKNFACGDFSKVSYVDFGHSIYMSSYTHAEGDKNQRRDLFVHEKINIYKSKKTVDYEFSSRFHSLETCEWGPNNLIADIKEGHENDFDFETKERIKKIVNLNRFCNNNWMEFLNKENGPIKKHKVSNGETLYDIAKQYGTKVEDLIDMTPSLRKEPIKAGQRILLPTGAKKISKYQLIYHNIDENKFPEDILLAAKDSKDSLLVTLLYRDIDKDYLYDYIQIIDRNPKVKNKEEIKINYETREVNYKKFNQDSLEIQKTGKSQEDFSPEIQKRIKDLVNLKVDCSENELIPFLYEEYGKWSEE